MPVPIEALGHLVKRVQHRNHRVLDARLTALGSSLVQWNALREIDRNPGASQMALADKTFNSAQAFGTLVTRLLARGFVARTPGGGRALVLTLTAKGKQVLKQGQTVMADVARDTFGALTKAEREQLARLLTKVLS